MSLKITIEVDSLSDLRKLKPLIDAISAPPMKSESLFSLNISTRTLEGISAEGISTVQELLEWDENRILRTPNLGRKSVNEIKDALAAQGLCLRAKP